MSSDKISGFRNKFVTIKSTKKRKTSSRQWLARQLNDQYVSKAKIEGYRSRSAYKLLEINEKFKLFQPGMKVVDLGAAPGGWSQVAAKITKADKLGTLSGVVIAVDLLEMEPISGVRFLQKDFYAADTQQIITEMSRETHNKATNLLPGEQDRNATPNFNKVDVVMSDMAANTTGHATTDHIRTLRLCESAFEFALEILKPKGHFIAKLVKHFKPAASRRESTETYLIALNRR
ncbi:Ribosomal RNA large subunit methyltransferase E [Pseudolycoriella hygida]|uniref:rRNA methyltransferase 2, mitochondrial n=1 Tax=Pseudolycoriella hygida TaxID=35572 RepID=A0A9Q0N7X4_9DIPT|nr:Ribosomal RNA large subunit methyltransferase E [Pseudolycoriella hygida]